MRRRLPTVALPLAAAGLALAACVGDTLVDPYRGHGIPCPFHALTGLWCPGCGSARAIYSLVHLDWSAALARNPLLVVALPYLLLRWVGWMSQSLGGPSLWALPPKRWVAPAVGGVIVAFWVARNLPWPEFRVLGPD
ncbi:MAG: DUF2752 domain-containing protein [Candidatus Dormibacteria bacterium]|jgi:hypothetical protein